jgi:hypothetical protein
MDPTEIIALVTQHKWVAIAALVVGMILRLVKDDVTFPVNISPKWRVWLALGLGGASGALNKLVEAGNTTWTTALTQGLLAAGLAIVSHNVFIDSLRGGREIVVPGLTKVNVAPGPGRPVSIKPPALPPAPPAPPAPAPPADRP